MSIAEAFNAIAGPDAQYVAHEYWEPKHATFGKSQRRLEVTFKAGERTYVISTICDKGEEAAVRECAEGAQSLAQIKARAA